jgi:hypothetical protein
MYRGLHVRYPLLSSDFNYTWHFLDRFKKNTQISNFMKIHPVGAELFHADGQTEGQTDRQTDMIKLIVAFHNFANTPKNTLCFRSSISIHI